LRRSTTDCACASALSSVLRSMLIFIFIPLGRPPDAGRSKLSGFYRFTSIFGTLRAKKWPVKAA
jgi:hypothetical protein